MAYITNKNINDLPEQIKELYRIVNDLENAFNGRHFTLDGHLIGSIGEVLASYYYGIKLYEASHPIHDGHIGKKEIQIKITQKNSITISEKPNYLIVLFLKNDGEVLEVYNGSGEDAWKLTKDLKKDKYNHFHISIKKLSKINESHFKPKNKIDIYSK